MRLPNSERTREELKKLYRHPHAQHWLVICAVLVVVITALAFLLSSQDATPIEDFLAEDWKIAMESRDGDMYEDLWDKSARKEWQQEFEIAQDTVIGKQLRVHLAGIRPAMDPVDPKGFIMRQIPVIFLRDGEEVTTQHTVRVARKGWLRRWKLVAHNITFPEPPEPVLTQALPEPGDADGKAEKISGGTSSAPQLSPTDNAPLDTQLKLRQILEAWRAAWEQKNLDEYFSWYAKEADITRVSVVKGKEYPRKLRKDQLRRHMERLNRKYDKIQVTLSNLQIVGDDAVADVNFLQEYTAWSNLTGKKLAYQDLGTKRLKFMIDPGEGNWKIYAETWKIYRDVPRKL